MGPKGTGEWVAALFESGTARKLSASAIAVYCYLAYRQGSHASAWAAVRRIARDLGMHLETVSVTMRELEGAGLIRREVVGHRGFLPVMRYHLTTADQTDVPPNVRKNRTYGETVRTEKPDVENRDTTASSEHRTEEPYAIENISYGFSMTNVRKFRTQPDREPDQDQDQEKTDPPSGGPPHPSGEDLSVSPRPKKKRRARPYTYTPEFEEFWRAYPRQVEKREAFARWNVRLQETLDDGTPITPALLIQAAQRYAEECRRLGTEERYMKHPSTFLGPKHPFADYLHRPEPAHPEPELYFIPKLIEGMKKRGTQ